VCRLSTGGAQTISVRVMQTPSGLGVS
jgi:hypothetical protein